jgi:hypothetical protein
MLEKLATHDVQDVSTLFSLADKCAKATKGHAWHSPAAQAAKGESKPSARGQAQGGGSSSKKKKKKADGNQLLAGAPTATAAAAGGRRGGPRDRSAERSRSSRNNSTKRCSSDAKMARILANGRASRRWTPRRRKAQRWSFRMPRGH